MQPQRRIPFTAGVSVAVGKRRCTDHGARRIQDRRLAVGRVGVAFGDGTGGRGDRGDGVLMVATERSSASRR